MATSLLPLRATPDEFVAQLSAVAYQVALPRARRGSFLDLELELWQALRAVFHEHAAVVGPPINQPTADHESAGSAPQSGVHLHVA